MCSDTLDPGGEARGCTAAAVRVCKCISEADFHNPGSMEEAREYGLPRGTYFVARRLELVAVARRLWISWCVVGGADFSGFFFCFYFFERTRPTLSTWPPCLMYLY